MSRLLSFLIFSTVGTTITAGVHYYLWVRLVRDARLPAPWPKVLSGVIIFLALLIPLTMVASRLLEPALMRFLAWPAYIWMGVMFLLFMSLLFTDVVKWLGLVVLKLLKADEGVADPERRVLMQRAVATTAVATVTVMAGHGVRRQLGGARVREVQVTLPRLPASMDGTTLVQMTDVHVGPTIGRKYIERLVEQANGLKPDIIAITGDLVDGSVGELGRATAPLGDLVARHGVYFVTGNHEYYSGVDAWLRELERLRMHVLRNERVLVGEPGAGFDLIGINDYSAGRFGEDPNLTHALKGRDPSREMVLLAHQPRAFPEAAQMGVGLQLSGHTHGGQIWPWNHFVKLQTPFVEGLYREGASQLYVSPGTGYWGPPMRVGTHAEITRVILRSGDRLASAASRQHPPTT